MTAASSPYRWPLLLATLGALFLLFSAWSAYRAVNGGSAVSDRDYYSHGLRYNHTRVEQKAAESLGWSLTAEVRGTQIAIRLADRAGLPVGACRGELELFASRPDTRLRLPLVETSPGLYTATIAPDLRGEISARLYLSRDGARIDRRLLFNL
jgi:nitrogen fixation protein FixH